MRLLSLCISLLLLTSCQNNETEYHINGKIKKKKYVVHDKIIVEEYDTLGKIMFKWCLINDVNDSLIKYNPNGTYSFKKKFLSSGAIYSVEYDGFGNRKQEGLYVQDTIKASWWKFYNGKLHNVDREYIILCNSNYLNQVIYFDKNLDTIKNDNNLHKSTYYDLSKNMDGDSLLISYRVKSYFANNKLELIILRGTYCEEEVDTLINLNKSHGRLKLSKKYSDKKGFFFDYNISSSDSINSHYRMKHHKKYFDLSDL